MNLKRCKRDKDGSFSAVAKYCAKYISKTVNDENAQIQRELNAKTYRFSYNCKTPVHDVEIVEWDYSDLHLNMINKSDFYKHFMGSQNQVIGYVCDYSIEN